MSCIKHKEDANLIMQLLHVTPVPNPSILWACVSFTRHHLTITGACLFDLKGSLQVELRQLNLWHTLLLIETEHNFDYPFLKRIVVTIKHLQWKLML